MKNIFTAKVTGALLIVAAAGVCCLAEALTLDSSILAAPGQNSATSNITAAPPSSADDVTSEAEQAALPPPPVYELKPEYAQALRLVKEQEAALHKYMPDFKPCVIGDYPASIAHYPYSELQLPYIVKGDFDGNGKADLILAGHTGAANVILAVMSLGPGYYILPLATAGAQGSSGHSCQDVLFLLKKGSSVNFEDEGGEGAAELMRNDSIQVVKVAPNDTSFSESTDPSALYKYEELLERQYYEEGHTEPVVPVSSATPSVLKPEYIVKLALTPPMEKALNAFDKNFTSWTLQDYPADIIGRYPYSAKTLPYALKGDLNGDGINDMVLAGHNNDENRLVILLSSGAAYVAADRGSVNSGPCYSEARKDGRQLPYRPSHVVKLQKKGLTFLNSANYALPKVTMNTETYSVEQIAKCKKTGKIDPVRSLYGDIYGDWHAAQRFPEHFGYIKIFQKQDGIPWRFIVHGDKGRCLLYDCL